ncbi:universal stress protein [Streptomyces sp. NPDC017979]|uniref:universal stress protein n=1 Tax=Streptomyces sp. NPDC017979 TaxID=3365024 RepID=UPI0037BC777D
MASTPVTVGLDGTRESLAAAHWAAEEAVARGTSLNLLHAWVLLTLERTDPPPEQDPDYWAKRIVATAQKEITARFPDLSVTEELVAEDPRAALLRAAEESRMVVVGSRGLGRFGGFFLGDTGLDIAGRAGAPVVLVRAPSAPPPNTAGGAARVVAALSLHGPCGGLLDFARATADARGLPLSAVHCRPLPPHAHGPGAPSRQARDDAAAQAERDLSRALAPWRARNPAVPLPTEVHLGSPARETVAAVEGAALLVIGRRTPPLPVIPHLGNVAQSCLHHASCPVAVVPHE